MSDKYMSMTFPTDKVSLLNRQDGTNVFDTMNSIFGVDGWTFKVNTTQYGQKSVFVGITLKMPGLERDGVALGHTVDIAVENAIWYVLGTINAGKPQVQQKSQQNQPVQTQNIPVNTPAPVPTPTPASTSSTPAAQSKVKTREQIIAQLATSFGISSEQANAFYNVRAKYQIATSSQLLKYLKNWNSEINDIKELNGSNIDAFISWAENNQPEAFTVRI